MASKERLKSGGITRLLADCGQPIYAIDRDRKILYINPACAEWLGIPADQLLDQVCHFESVPEQTGPLAAIAALCPPPEVLQQTADHGNVYWPDTTGTVRPWHVSYRAMLNAEGDLLGWMGTVQTHLTVSASADQEAEKLHQEILRWQRFSESRFRLTRFTGRSPAINRLHQQVEIAKQVQCDALILSVAARSRSATQNAEYLANLMHNLRPQAADSARLYCQLLSEELLLETLNNLRPIKVWQENDQASLILVDIDTLTEEAQRALIRCLNDRSFPWRVFATSSKPRSEVATCLVPELTEWLQTFVITIPSLASRVQEDLPLVCQAFVEEINARDRLATDPSEHVVTFPGNVPGTTKRQKIPSNKQLSGLTSEAIDLLCNYTWPGDLPELEQVIRQAYVVSTGPRITVADLPTYLQHAQEADALGPKSDEPINLEAHLQAVERQLIQQALDKAGGNKAEAARLLQLTRPRLYRRLEQLGLEDS